MRIIELSLSIGLAFAILLPSQSFAQSSACLTNADTAAFFTGSVRQAVTLGDSAKLTQQGIPYKPTQGVSLVTSAQTCSKAVTAFNAGLPVNDSGRITKAYVVKVGNSAYAVIGDKMSKSAFALTFYDTKFKLLTIMAFLD